MKERQVYKIPMRKDYTPEEMNEIIKNWSLNQIDLQIVQDTYSFKCPFRINKQEDFLSCYGENCMAFRKDSEHFWCAKLEPTRENSNSLHPIQFYNEDDNW